MTLLEYYQNYYKIQTENGPVSPPELSEEEIAFLNAMEESWREGKKLTAFHLRGRGGRGTGLFYKIIK